MKIDTKSLDIALNEFDLARLLNADAVHDLVVDLVKESMGEISLDIEGDQMVARGGDQFDYEQIAERSLAEALNTEIDDSTNGDGEVVGPQSYLDKIKATLAVLEASVVRYREAVANWVIDEWEDLEGAAAEEDAATKPQPL